MDYKIAVVFLGIVFIPVVYGVVINDCGTYTDSGYYELTASFFNSTTFFPDSCITFTNDNVYFDCNGYQIQTSGLSFSSIFADAVTNITITNCVFNATNDNMIFTTRILNSDTIHVSNSTKIPSANSGMHIENGNNIYLSGNFLNASTISISNSNFTYITDLNMSDLLYGAISLTRVNHTLISNLIFNGEAVVLWGKNITISNSNITRIQVSGSDSNVSIHDNHFKNCTGCILTAVKSTSVIYDNYFSHAKTVFSFSGNASSHAYNNIIDECYIPSDTNGCITSLGKAVFIEKNHFNKVNGRFLLLTKVWFSFTNNTLISNYVNMLNSSAHFIKQNNNYPINLYIYNQTYNKNQEVIYPSANIERYWYYSTITQDTLLNRIPFSNIYFNSSWKTVFKQSNHLGTTKNPVLFYTVTNNVTTYASNYTSYADHPMYERTNTIGFNLSQTNNYNYTFTLTNQSKTLTIRYKINSTKNLTIRYYNQTERLRNITLRYILP